ncbi:pilus assembly protein PilX [Diaphorobacter sp. HDW4B]|uniref:pilus assembly PilX family protein n=1 Tax=Diaphorobacter sp. HDW4B TaxID=2714925 RepID=UPI00140D4D39|nr:PilX N-terminal domain-containing pilus assembly protein [Diaphorobacter sp. HDW4B]QIL70821.1 pilus assembly protein PilX [Diaphorobacter sp. HDW4B]
MPEFHFKRHCHRQNGAALYIVLIIVLMTSLLAIWASRSALFHEILTGNEADYQRTFEAAQILLKDAELDIRSVQASGTPCSAANATGNVCRASTSVHFPHDRVELVDLISYLNTLPSGCAYGICRKRSGFQDFWSDPTTLLQMTAANVGARYGQFTGAAAGPGGNPILGLSESSKQVKDLKGAWYWIEVLSFANSEVGLLSTYDNNPHLKAYAPDKSVPWIYRITVYARGQKKGTEVVLQTVLSLQSSE